MYYNKNTEGTSVSITLNKFLAITAVGKRKTKKDFMNCKQS